MAKEYNEADRIQEDTVKVINKWERILLSESAPKLSRDDMGIMARLIDEQHKWVEEEYQRLGKNLQESAVNTTAGIEPFLKILVPTLRRAYKSMSVLDLVGIQPMNAPSGYVYALRFHYAGDKDNSFNSPTGLEYTMGSGYVPMSYVLVIPRVGAVNIDTGLPTTAGAPLSMTADCFTVGRAVVLNTAITKTSDENIVLLDAYGSIAYVEQTTEFIKVVINRLNPNTIALPVSTNTLAFTNVQASALSASPTAVDVTKCYRDAVTAYFDNEIGYRFILKNYTGPVSTQTGEGMETWKSGTPGTAASTSPFYKTIKITMERAAVHCESRKLKLQYSDELYQDLKAVHGLLANEELMRIAEFEVANEINASLLENIYEVATYAGNWSYGQYVGVSLTNPTSDAAVLPGFTKALYADGRYEKEKFQTLATKLRNEANKIALFTRRGSGNFVIVTPNVLTALQALDFIPAAATSGDTLISGLSFVGMLQTLKVYVDTYNFFGQDFACVGYKGTTQYDAGIIYAPYVALQVKKAVDPDSMQDVYGFLTRQAVIKNLYGAQHYYRMVTVDLTGSSIG